MMLEHLRQPTLIDTDIGDDVDDAFALALALALPDLDVVGVTTVGGPVAARARLARVILAAAGQPDVPVASGSSAMRDGRAGPDRFSHQAVLEAGDRRSESEAPPISTEMILESSQRHSPLTIVALGPLTNIAAALDRDPALARRARLIAMAGSLGLPYPDWNLRCDPHAARRVLASGMPATLVGMQVTLGAKMHAAQLHRLFAAGDPLTSALARCVLAWRTWKRRMPILHDALTVAVAADPTLARLQPRRVVVGWRGFSAAARGLAPNALVCTAADLDRFHALLDTWLLGGTGEPERQAAWRRLLRAIA